MRGKSSVDEYVAQLRAKGERFYFTDPPFPKMTNGTPALDKFVSAADAIGGFNPIEVMDVNTSGVAVVAWQRAPMVEYGRGPTPIPWSQLLTTLSNNAKPLREIRDSVSDPEPDMGWQTNVLNYRKIFVQERKAAQLLAAATVAALHETNYNEALEDLLALARMARMETNENTLVAQMVRVAISGLASSATWEALQSDGLTDAQWRQLQAEWGKVDLLKAIEQGFVGERLLCFNHMEMLRKGDTNAVNWNGGKIRWHDRFETMIWRATVAQQDELFYLKTLERYIDHCRSVSTGTPAVEVNKFFEEDIAKLNQLLSQPMTRFKYPFSTIAIPNFARASRTAFRNEVHRRLAVTAIGIKRYQLRHRKLPNSLQELVPEFCPDVLLDPMDWKPLRYRVNADGTFTLYSVGDNGLDDGGSAAGTITNLTTSWLDRSDIVWPKAAQTNSNN